jgi:lysophospholipase L1-like esterase
MWGCYRQEALEIPSVPFFCSNYLTRNDAFLGTSITANFIYVNTTNDYIRTHSPFPSLLSTVNAGIGGSTSWYALASQLEVITANSPDAVCVEFAVNDAFTEFYAKTAEALIRRIRTVLPLARIVFIAFTRVGDPAVDDATNLNQDIHDRWKALCNLYGVAFVSFADALVSAVAGGEHVATYMTDTLHPTATGHALAATVLEATMASAVNGGTMPVLPARLYDCADFENAPIVRNGTDNEGETGTWTTVSTTSRRSTVANSTISWTGTFVSCGIQTVDGVISWQIDGGAWTQLDLTNYGPGIELTTTALVRGVHTLTIRVDSGTVQIDRFLSV